jgi:hypothetical protein
MTPTPDPTTAAAPLTEEQIAAIRDAYELHCVVVYMGDVEAADRTERNRLLYVEFNNLLLSHEALRDTLANLGQQLVDCSGLANELYETNEALRDRLVAAEGRERELREVGARFRDAAMLLASLTDYVEGEGISAQVWYQEFFWAISDIQECVTEIEPDYTDAALTILRRANERYPYRTRHHAALAPRTARHGAGMRRKESTMVLSDEIHALLHLLDDYARFRARTCERAAYQSHDVADVDDELRTEAKVWMEVVALVENIGDEEGGFTAKSIAAQAQKSREYYNAMLARNAEQSQPHDGGTPGGDVAGDEGGTT